MTPRFSAVMILAGALLAGSIATVVAPAESASALAIDCSYDSGLSVFIGTGRDGLTCMGGGTRTPGTVYGSGSLPGQGVPGGVSAGSVCSYPTPGLPDSFYAWGNITARSFGFDYVRGDGSKWRITGTAYSRDGKDVATRSVETSPGQPVSMTFHDFTLLDASGAGVVLQSTFNCASDATWMTLPPRIMSSADLTTPPAPSPVVHQTLDTVATMAPVPFHAGEYFLRIDLTNNHPAPSTTPAVINLGLSAYEISSIVSMPASAGCPSATPLSEQCMSPLIMPGETQSFTFVVKQKPGANAHAPVLVQTFHEGYRKEGVVNRPGTAMSLTTVAP